MKIDRTAQIVQAMTGRQASAVNDNALREAVRSKLITLAQDAGKPLSSGEASSITIKVCTAAARTIIFEAEVPIALEMGAAGELSHEGSAVTSTNAPRWVTAYAVSGDRRAAQERISIAASRDRARIDAIAADDLRVDFQSNGLCRAWDTFNAEGWTFVYAGYGAAIYNLIGKARATDLLRGRSDLIRGAKDDALREIRSIGEKYRKAGDEDIQALDIFETYYKAHLARACFEQAQRQGLDINYKPAAL